MSSPLNSNQPPSNSKRAGQSSGSASSQSKAVQPPSQHQKSSASSSKASPKKTEVKPSTAQLKAPTNSRTNSSPSPQASSSVGSPKHTSSSSTSHKSDHHDEFHAKAHRGDASAAKDQVDRAQSSFAKIPETHYKCRKPPMYTRAANQPRFLVPDEYVSWNVPFPSDYEPFSYTDEHLLGDKRPPYADADINPNDPAPIGFKFNEIDGKIDRRSHMGPYNLVNNMPQNPVGRTGLVGRGVLGRWGPNHAADPIVTRWKRDEHGAMVSHEGSGRPILQFLAIERRDNHEWAIPGGMVDAGEKVATTLRREFCEEAMDMLHADENSREELRHKVDQWFAGGTEVYRGYVDDPRNTDNAWMETVAYNFHDENGVGLGHFEFRAGDDAVGVRWMDLSADLQLYASHSDFLREVARRHDAHWK